MFVRILTSALFAGAAAGFFASLLQLYFVQPVLVHAELYESGELVHFGGEAVSAFQELGGFQPVRDMLSIIFTMLIYAGYGLVIVSAMAFAEQRGTKLSPKQGVIWGLAGFIAVHFAPGFSLAPEVPGVAAADVYARQFWWFATVACAASAMWIIAFGSGVIALGTAAILLLAPHIIGAPQPDTFTGPVPTELSALFASRAFGVGMVAWVLLGVFSAFFWQRESDRESGAQSA